MHQVDKHGHASVETKTMLLQWHWCALRDTGANCNVGNSRDLDPTRSVSMIFSGTKGTLPKHLTSGTELRLIEIYLSCDCNTV